MIMEKNNMIYNCQSPSHEDDSKRSFVMTHNESNNFTHFRMNRFMQMDDNSQSDL